MKIKQKQTKIGTKRAFSYKKAKNKVRKRRGLSPVSTLGLTLAFNNRNIGKKVILSIISAVMIALILLSMAIIFSTPEKTFYINMKQKNVPFVRYHVGGMDYDMTDSELDKLNGYVNQKYGKPFVQGGMHYLNAYLSGVEPLNQESVPEYFSNANLARWSALFVDEPKDLGIEIVKGVAPKMNDNKFDEIAISKTYYDYLRTVGKFTIFGEELVDFGQKDFIGENIECLNIKITGVFEDYNNYDKNAKYDIGERILDAESGNFLICAIIRPEQAKEDMKNFMAYNNFHKVTTSKANGGTFGDDAFCNVMPINNFTKKYFFKNEDLQKDLAENEIVIADYRYYDSLNDKVCVGDTIDLQFVKTHREYFTTNVKQEYFRGDFVVKAMNRQSEGAVFVNKKIFDIFYTLLSPQIYTTFAVNSSCVRESFFKDVRNFCYTQISDNIVDILNAKEHDFSLFYSMINFDYENNYNTNLVKIMNTYVAIPLLAVAIFVLVVLLLIIMSDIVKEKSKDILILKCLGARQKDIAIIFVVSIAVLLLLQFAVGLSLGIGLMSAFNKFWGAASNYDIYYDTFYIGWDSALLMILSILAVSACTIWYSLQRLKGRNLRRMFQRQKA